MAAETYASIVPSAVPSAERSGLTRSFSSAISRSGLRLMVWARRTPGSAIRVVRPGTGPASIELSYPTSWVGGGRPKQTWRSDEHGDPCSGTRPWLDRCRNRGAGGPLVADQSLLSTNPQLDPNAHSTRRH